MTKPVYVTQALLPPKEAYLETISQVWDTHILTNRGELHQQLEQALKQYLDVPNLVLYANGHLALESLLQVLNLQGEVITTPFTFVSTTNAIIRCGLTPVFCDILEDDFTMDPSKIESLITEKTCAIMPVHVYGHLCHMDRIEAIAEKYGLPVIYDAAHAFGVQTGECSPLLRGTASVLSFHATKIFNTVEGGAVISKDESLLRRVYQNSNYGIEGPEITQYVGGNAKMSEFHAAMGLCNLKYVDAELEKRHHIAQLYRSLLDGIKEIQIPPVPRTYQLNDSYFPVVFRPGKDLRDQVYQTLADHGYFTRKYFYPLTCDQLCIRNRYPAEHLVVARRISDGILCLPIYGNLRDDQVHSICRIIHNLLKERRMDS